MKLSDSPVPLRLKLSALWATAMFLYIYGDYFGLFQPGALTAMIDGKTPVGPTTQGKLIAFSIMMTIPSVMVFLSLVLPPTAARWTNIVLGVLYSIIIVLTMQSGWVFYRVLGVVEIAVTLTVAWSAWTWPRHAA